MCPCIWAQALEKNTINFPLKVMKWFFSTSIMRTGLPGFCIIHFSESSVLTFSYPLVLEFCFINLQITIYTPSFVSLSASAYQVRVIWLTYSCGRTYTDELFFWKMTLYTLYYVPMLVLGSKVLWGTQIVLRDWESQNKSVVASIPVCT